MKKTTTFQTLFDNLPIEMLSEHPVEEEEATLATVNRVWRSTATSLKLGRKTVTRRRLTWLIPAVVVLMVIAVVAGSAASQYWFTPTYSFQPPVITVEPIVPLVEGYEEAVDVNVVAENDGMRVTLDKYVVDPVDGIVRMLIQVETTDGTVLTELTTERMSQIVRTTFARIKLSVSDTVDAAADSTDIGYGLKYNAQMLRRSDVGSDPHKATFEYRYYYNAGEGEDLLGKTYTLQLTDLRDEVQVCGNLGFTYESMQALYNDATPADDADYVQGNVKTTWADGQFDYYHTLKDGGQKIRFSTVYTNAYIDNIGFRNDLSREFDSQLYISFDGLSTMEEWPVLIDMRTGSVYYYTLNDVDDNGQVMSGPLIDIAAYMGIVDENDRVTLTYNNVSPDMLPYLFMMQERDAEFITRKEGTWELTFTAADSGMAVREFDVDAVLTFHEYDLHVTHLEMTDGSLYFDGEYSVNSTAEAATKWASIYGTIDLVMADGTVLENPFNQGPCADIYDVREGTGSTRWGGEFNRFIDTSQVVAVIALGEEIPLA